MLLQYPSSQGLKENLSDLDLKLYR
jgi:hypothetical protein